jgi:hypothetical protein
MAGFSMAQKALAHGRPVCFGREICAPSWIMPSLFLGAWDRDFGDMTLSFRDHRFPALGNYQLCRSRNRIKSLLNTQHGILTGFTISEHPPRRLYVFHKFPLTNSGPTRKKEALQHMTALGPIGSIRSGSVYFKSRVVTCSFVSQRIRGRQGNRHIHSLPS